MKIRLTNHFCCMSDIGLSHKKHHNDSSDFKRNCGLYLEHSFCHIQNNMTLGMCGCLSRNRNLNNSDLRRY